MKDDKLNKKIESLELDDEQLDHAAGGASGQAKKPLNGEPPIDRGNDDERPWPPSVPPVRPNFF